MKEPNENMAADARGDRGEESSIGHESIRALVMQEAAAAIIAAGRELTSGEARSVREFLRGPALKVGLALSVLGVTLWISQLSDEHRRRQDAHRRASAPSGASSRMRRGRSRGPLGA